MGLFSRTKTVDLFFVGCDGTDLDRGIYGFYLDVTNGQIVKKKFVKSLANPIAMRPFGRFMNITYRNGRVDTVNKHKVKVAYKSMKYYDENMKSRTSPKGTLYTFGQSKTFGQDAAYLFNKKGQLLVSRLAFTDSYYRYDAKGYMVKGSEFDLTTGVGPNVFTSKNTYKGSVLVSRVVKGVYDSEYTNHDKITYKKIRVKDVKTVKKQQRLLLNNDDTLAYIF